MTCPKSQTYEHKAGDDSSRISISSVQLCPTLCDPMDCSTTGFLVHHQLLELARTHVHPVGDAVQPSHPLSSPSPPSFSLAQLSVPPAIRRLSFLCPPACFCLLLRISFRRQGKSREAHLSSTQWIEIRIPRCCPCFGHKTGAVS